MISRLYKNIRIWKKAKTPDRVSFTLSRKILKWKSIDFVTFVFFEFLVNPEIVEFIVNGAVTV